MTYNTCLLKYGADKKWERIIKPQLIQESDKNVALHYPFHSFIDSNGLLWFTNDSGNCQVSIVSILRIMRSYNTKRNSKIKMEQNIM